MAVPFTAVLASAQAFVSLVDSTVGNISLSSDDPPCGKAQGTAASALLRAAFPNTVY